MKIAVMGQGKQGKRIADNLKALGVLSGTYDPLFNSMEERDELLSVSDAVVVATHSSAHFRIAATCLRLGKHALVEKPMTKDASRARELVRIAEKAQRVLMVGHNTLYQHELHIIKDRIENPAHYHSVRTNPEGHRDDDNALWRLLPHDVAMCVYLFGYTLEVVYSSGNHNTAVAELRWVDGSTASLFSSWSVPVRIREARIYDENGISAIIDEEGDNTLRAELKYFINCIENNRTPLTDGHFGVKVVEILEKIEQKMMVTAFG